MGPDYAQELKLIFKKNKISTVDIVEVLGSRSFTYKKCKEGRLTWVEINKIAEYYNKKIVFDLLPKDDTTKSYEELQTIIDSQQKVITLLMQQLDEAKAMIPKKKK